MRHTVTFGTPAAAQTTAPPSRETHVEDVTVGITANRTARIARLLREAVGNAADPWQCFADARPILILLGMAILLIIVYGG